MHFPPHTSTSLAGKQFNLPEDLSGEYHLLLMIFGEQYHPKVETWLPCIEAMRDEYPNISFYEVPILPQRDFFASQQLFDISMRIRIRDPRMRALTLPLYVDVDEFCEMLDLGERNQVYMLLIDHTGYIWWRTFGEYDILASLSLRETLETLFEETEQDR